MIDYVYYQSSVLPILPVLYHSSGKSHRTLLYTFLSSGTDKLHRVTVEEFNVTNKSDFHLFTMFWEFGSPMAKQEFAGGGAQQ